MNFFSRKNKIFISLNEEDLLNNSDSKLQADIDNSLPQRDGIEVTISLKSIDKVLINNLAIILRFSIMVKKKNSSIYLVASKKIIDEFKILNFHQFFDSLITSELEDG